MSVELLTPQDTLTVLPGRIVETGTVDNANQNGLSMRCYLLDKIQVHIPAMRDYMLVRWKSSPRKLGFHNSRDWQEKKVTPGNVTLLARGEPSNWYWMDDIHVSHIYASESAITRVANEIFDKEIDQLNIEHSAQTDDPVLSELMLAYERECNSGSLGGELYTRTIETQICIHLIRQYANCHLREASSDPKISSNKRREIETFIADNLDQNITIEQLADVAGLSQSYFARVFRNDFGTPPHAFVLSRRLEKARQILASRPETPIKVVTMECGFSDQSHLTRLFKDKYGLTPDRFRKRKLSGLDL